MEWFHLRKKPKTCIKVILGTSWDFQGAKKQHLWGRSEVWDQMSQLQNEFCFRVDFTNQGSCMGFSLAISILTANPPQKKNYWPEIWKGWILKLQIYSKNLPLICGIGLTNLLRDGWWLQPKDTIEIERQRLLGLSWSSNLQHRDQITSVILSFV